LTVDNGAGIINNQLALKGVFKGKRVMKATIEDTCTACGLCVDTCPEVFKLGDDIASVIVNEVPAELEDAVQQAAEECPVECIIIE